nr:unnamed protein product [Callosobruchus analis]
MFINMLGIGDKESIVKHITGSLGRIPLLSGKYFQSLRSDLSISKMYLMFLDELEPNAKKPCLSLYRLFFKSMNLSFHRPRKDQCGSVEFIMTVQ